MSTLFSTIRHFIGQYTCPGSHFFGLQIYGDFSGYSDIAIGTARLFGFDLMQNFAFPYLFRGHIRIPGGAGISPFTTWFRIIYIPLG